MTKARKFLFFTAMADLGIGSSYYDSTAFNKMHKKSERQFSVVHMNTRSIKNKVENSKAFLNSVNVEFDTILFTETWLMSIDIPPQFQGYVCESAVRQEKRGGGIAIYIKDTLRYHVIDEFTTIDNNIECLAVKISNTVVVALYRPPSGNISEFMKVLDNLLCFLGSMSCSFMILGDINIDTISDNPRPVEVTDLINEYACYNAISLPTRVTPETATCLDIRITNLDQNDMIAGIFAHDISDHLPIFCLVSTSAMTHKTNTFWHRTINEETLLHFGCLIEQENWDDVYRENNATVAYKCFITKFRNCYDTAFPEGNKSEE